MTPNIPDLNGLTEALEHGGGGHSLGDVLSAVKAGTAQLWAEDGCVLVTEINDAPNHRELHFWLATGTLDAVIALSNKVIEWGREQGCTVASLCGRKGWERALRDEGWHHQMVQMGREI